MIITRGGEQVLPQVIEDRIKSEVPFLGHVVVVGHQRLYITALLTLKVRL